MWKHVSTEVLTSQNHHIVNVLWIFSLTYSSATIKKQIGKIPSVFNWPAMLHHSSPCNQKINLLANIRLASICFQLWQFWEAGNFQMFEFLICVLAPLPSLGPNLCCLTAARSVRVWWPKSVSEVIRMQLQLVYCVYVTCIVQHKNTT